MEHDTCPIDLAAPIVFPSWRQSTRQILLGSVDFCTVGVGWVAAVGSFSPVILVNQVQCRLVLENVMYFVAQVYNWSSKAQGWDTENTGSKHTKNMAKGT